MIIDKLKNWESYVGITPYLKAGMEFALSLTDQPAGRYECDTLPEGAVFVLIQEGDTVPYEAPAKLEAHKKYLDVQIMLEGGESAYYADIEELTVTDPYDEAKDLILFEKAGTRVRVPAGTFFIVLPQDGHMACREMDGPGKYRKLVVKVKL